MINQIRHLLEMIRFSHTLFALPFALLSALLAWRDTPCRGQDLLGSLLCMVFARSAAMAFNRLTDRKLDAANPRTADRHLPAGILSVRSVALFTIVCAGGFVAATLLFLPNVWPLRLAAPVLAFLLGYSYAKRWTQFCHYWLSAALMLSPIAVWIALTGSIAWTPVILGLVIFFWVGGFDIIYACQDTDVDRSQGLQSIPARWGVPAALRIAFLSHLLAIGGLFGLWWVAGLGSVFLIGSVLISMLLLYQHRLVRPDDLGRVNVAFFNVNAVVSMGVLLLGAVDLWVQS